MAPSGTPLLSFVYVVTGDSVHIYSLSFETRAQEKPSSVLVPFLSLLSRENMNSAEERRSPVGRPGLDNACVVTDQFIKFDPRATPSARGRFFNKRLDTFTQIPCFAHLQTPCSPAVDQHDHTAGGISDIVQGVYEAKCRPSLSSDCSSITGYTLAVAGSRRSDYSRAGSVSAFYAIVHWLWHEPAPTSGPTFALG